MQMSCMIYIYTTTKMEDINFIQRVSNTVFVFVFTYWCLFSFKQNQVQHMLKFTTFIIIPLLGIIQFLEIFSFMHQKYFEKVEPNPTQGSNWIERNNISLLIIICFFYTLVSTIKANRLIVKNEWIVSIRFWSNHLLTNSQQTPFNELINFLYENFFLQFNYLILTMIILVTLIEVNLINLFLMFYSITFLSMQQKSNKAWVYYVFVLDLLVLVK